MTTSASSATPTRHLRTRQGSHRFCWKPAQLPALEEQRASISSGPLKCSRSWRTRINASTMLAQGKNLHQAEIDAACEFIDFLRFNCHFAQEIYAQQPESAPGLWNRLEYRALEGFVFAITPFNFTAIAGNLPISAALMGNVVVWKPSDDQIYSAHVIMELLHAAGLPEGVINLVTVDGPAAGDVVFSHPDFAGLHFTGSTGVFRHLWKTIGENIAQYKTYPRIVGETGGKDFIVAHRSADVDEVVTGIVRGSFEFQGQKCSGQPCLPPRQPVAGNPGETGLRSGHAQNGLPG